MTCAVAEAIMNGGQKDDFIDAMKKYGRMYPDAGYGLSSHGFSNDLLPYNSFVAQPCVFLLVLGSWIVVSVPEQELGRPEELLHGFLQK